MIETREQYATLLDDVRDLGYASLGSTDAEAIIETIEALRRLARAAKEIEAGEEYYMGKESANDYDATIEAICEQLRDALAYIEQHAPWLLEDE